MIQQVTRFHVSCDRCGDSLSATEFNSVDEAQRIVELYEDWKEIDGKQYCHDCWYEDEDEIPTARPIIVCVECDKRYNKPDGNEGKNLVNCARKDGWTVYGGCEATCKECIEEMQSDYFF